MPGCPGNAVGGPEPPGTMRRDTHDGCAAQAVYKRFQGEPKNEPGHDGRGRQRNRRDCAFGASYGDIKDQRE
jgi:hypothetical protein